MILHGSGVNLLRDLALPDMPALPRVKRQMFDYQMAALFALARAHNLPGARILEIGTGHGASGYMLAKAAPQALIVSLTTAPVEAGRAKEFWHQQGCRNISVLVQASWDYWASAPSGWRMIFVDGDHNHIGRDLPWFNRLAVGGLWLCHDYSPAGSRAPSPVVYAALNDMAKRLGRAFDVCLIDDDNVGMAGFYRRDGESV